jgi:DNA processing protein
MKETSHQVVDTIRSNAETEFDAETVARVAWASITDPGDREVGRLVEERGPVAALEVALDPDVEWIEGINLPSLRRRLGPRTTIRVARSLRAAAENGWSILTPLSASWPNQCNALGVEAPLCLWVAGDPSLLTRATFVVTGTTTPTDEATIRTTELSMELADRGWVITATGNAGIETCGHRGGMAMHAGTIAMLPCGVDQAYPVGSELLLSDIERAGAVVSAFAPGTIPSAPRRAARNRLVAAISVKTVVVDAELDSDATGIAEESTRLGRPIGVVAPSGPEPETSGCRQVRRWFGGRPIRDVVDIDRL